MNTNGGKDKVEDKKMNDIPTEGAESNIGGTSADKQKQQQEEERRAAARAAVTEEVDAAFLTLPSYPRSGDAHASPSSSSSAAIVSPPSAAATLLAAHHHHHPPPLLPPAATANDDTCQSSSSPRFYHPTPRPTRGFAEQSRAFADAKKSEAAQEAARERLAEAEADAIKLRRREEKKRKQLLKRGLLGGGGDGGGGNDSNVNLNAAVGGGGNNLEGGDSSSSATPTPRTRFFEEWRENAINAGDCDEGDDGEEEVRFYEGGGGSPKKDE